MPKDAPATEAVAELGRLQDVPEDQDRGDAGKGRARQPDRGCQTPTQRMEGMHTMTERIKSTLTLDEHKAAGKTLYGLRNKVLLGFIGFYGIELLQI